MKNDTRNCTDTAKKTQASSNLTPEMVKEGIADALTAFVGGGQKYPVAILAEKLGKSPRTIYEYKSGQIPICGTELMLCMHILPIDFANRVMAVIGLNGLHRSDANSSNILELGSDLAMLSGHIALDSSDGRIDHKEAARLEQSLRTKATRMLEQADELAPIAKSGGSMPVFKR